MKNYMQSMNVYIKSLENAIAIEKQSLQNSQANVKPYMDSASLSRERIRIDTIALKEAHKTLKKVK
jgi:hypothetical protein